MVGKSSRLMIQEALLVKELKHNLFSISQLCDKGNSVRFDSSGCKVVKSKLNETLFTSSRSKNIYIMKLNKFLQRDVGFLNNEDQSWNVIGE